MGRHKFSNGGGSRKAAKREVSRFKPKARTEVMRVSTDTLQDIARAQALYDANDWDACEIVIKRLLKQGFNRNPLTYDALGSVAQFQGRIDVALKCLRKAIEVDPGYEDARNRIIMIMDAQPETSDADAKRERRKWWDEHGAPLYARRKPHLNNRDPERPIRVGYVSADFQYHSAATVFHRIVTEHTEGFVPYFYSSTPHGKWDHITATYRSMPGWRDVVGWQTSMIADKIRTDQIDILVDLSNFTGSNRLGVFCWKPAPIQLTGWGYALSTGFPCFDGVMTDAIVGSDGGEENVLMPSVIDYGPLQGLPEANPLPCLTERPTFGVFQRSLKLNADNLEVYRQILERLPEARLIMKSHYCETFQQWIRSHFGAQLPQVEIRLATSSFEHKCQYQEVDLCLDTWPQGGGVSTCDALHMGVPAVTLWGERSIFRATASLLTNVGLPQFIAHSKEEYIQKAVDFVTVRKDELAAIRPTLRQRLAESPICTGYLEATETVYRDLWRRWCAKPLTIADAMYRLEKAG